MTEIAQQDIKVLVVDDSALMRTVITEILASDPAVNIVGVARTGVEAVSKAASLKPDVITLDIEMPELSGLEALRHIMRKSPTKVIMISGLSTADVTYEALSSGAVDFIAKPAGTFSPNMSNVADELIEKVHVAAGVDVTRLHTADQGAPKHEQAKPPAVKRSEILSKTVAIASSTGGPAAVERIVAELPGDLPAACLIVQHLPVGFSNSFTKRLDQKGQLEVRAGEAGDKVRPGVVYVAPAGHHMTVANRPTMGPVIRLDQSRPISGLRPAADRTMESVADVYGEKAIGVVLTGMGSDGAIGLWSIKRAGGYTMAQDEETSVVYGMPKAAVDHGAVDRIVPIYHVAAEIRKAVNRKGPVRSGH